MSSSGGFHDLLFEMSNEYRYGILLILRDQRKRITELSREMELTLTEVRRHVLRLSETGLIQRDTEGYYHLSEIGKIILVEIQEFDFVTRNKAYLNSHTLKDLPPWFIKRLGDLNEGHYVGNVVDFIRQTESIITEAQDYVWLLVDQLPIYNLSSILEAMERGVEFRVIEPSDRVLNPDIDSLTSEETRALARSRQTPLTEQRLMDEVNVFLYVSERKCAFSIPTFEGVFDYNGFVATDKIALGFCRDVFNYFWHEAELRVPSAHKEVVRGPLAVARDLGQVIVEGREDPDVDTQAVQDAVDNYDEVILKGKFNIGTSTVYISRSVVLRGEGRENDIPSTKVYKRGWTFPSYVPEFFLVVDGEGIDVTIENIHFTDYNYCCIRTRQGNSVKIRDNRITLETGRGRGISTRSHEAQVIGIISGGPGDVVIEGNYFDFDLSHSRGGFYTMWLAERAHAGIETDPNYRPDLKLHESYCGVGICLNFNSGRVIVRDNIVRNMNSKGIYIMDNYESADIHVIDNTIVSEVYGSYPFSQQMAGVGIFIQSSWGYPRSGARVEISGNEIRCDKVNYCGIAVYGPSMYWEGAGKLGECIVRDNDIHLGDGSVGVLIRKNDRTEVINNKISGKAYYGFYLWGSRDREGFNLGSNENLVEDNDMTDLEIKAPDVYSDSHVDGRMFTGSEGKSTTAHVWLNAFSRDNVIKIRADETVIDEGEDNKITYIDN